MDAAPATNTPADTLTIPCQACGARKALVLKVDIDRYPKVATEFGVRAIPSFVVIRNRKIVSRQAGLARPRTMQGWLSAD